MERQKNFISVRVCYGEGLSIASEICSRALSRFCGFKINKISIRRPISFFFRLIIHEEVRISFRLPTFFSNLLEIMISFRGQRRVPQLKRILSSSHGAILYEKRREPRYNRMLIRKFRGSKAALEVSCGYRDFIPFHRR